MERLRTRIVAMYRAWYAHVRRWRSAYGLVFAGLGVLAIYTVPQDDAMVAAISGDQQKWLGVAQALSHWGDFRGTLIVAVLLGGAGSLLRLTRLRNAALAVVLAAATAGAVANVGRVIVGRPRPVSWRPDGVYGPTFDYKHHSFPSAHASTAAATAFATLSAVPALGIPLVGGATAVIWSRIYLRAHHPTDVIAGAYLGALFGLGLGVAARRRN